MTRKLLNRNGMGETVSAYMDKNKIVWGSNLAIVKTVSDLNSSLGGVSQKMQEQEKPILGEAEMKALIRHDFEDEILRVAGQLSALAAEKGDAVLAAQVEFTLPQLDKLDGDVLEETGKRVSGLGTVHLASLADYGITQIDLTALDGLTTQFHGAKTAPRTAVAGRSGQTKTLLPAVKGTTSILRNRLDKQLLMFKKTNPEFYAGYLSARVVVDRGGGPSSSKPAVTPAP
jgi:hypothetical protein